MCKNNKIFDPKWHQLWIYYNSQSFSQINYFNSSRCPINTLIKLYFWESDSQPNPKNLLLNTPRQTYNRSN